MTDNEYIFTVYSAYKMLIEHEVMESFEIDNITLVNPHIDYHKLLEISQHEVVRGAKVIDEDSGDIIIRC